MKNVIKVCGRCARISKEDLEKRFCPFAAQYISHGRRADKCSMFIQKEDTDVRKKQA